MGWLFFHPSAWRNYVFGIDPNLAPNFALIDLNRQQWHNPDLHRLLTLGYIVWPLLLIIFAGLGLVPSAVQRDDLAVNIIFSLTGSLASSLVVALVVGVAVGIVFSVVGGTIGIIFSSLPQYDIDTTLLLGPLTGEAIYLAILAGVVGYVAGTISSRETHYGLTRQFGSVAIGVIVSSIVLGVVYLVMINTGKIAPPGRWFIFASGVVFTMLISIAFGVIFGWRTQNWQRSVIGGISSFFIIGCGGLLLLGSAAMLYNTDTPDPPFIVLILVGIFVGFAAGLLFSLLFAFSYLLTESIAGPWAGAVAGTLGSCWVYIAFAIRLVSQDLVAEDQQFYWLLLPLSFIIMILALTMSWWRPVLLYPLVAAWNRLLYQADERRVNQKVSLLRWHSAFWDEFQRLPLTGLDDHLVLVARRNPIEGDAAISFLSTGRQRWAAQAAQIKLDTDALAVCDSVLTIGQAHRQITSGELTNPASALLRSFNRVSQDVEAALEQESIYNQRLALSAVEDRLDVLFRELTRSSEAYASDFQPIATNWRHIIANHIHDLIDLVEQRQEIDNPYIIGVPLTEAQEIFVGRTDITARIEQLLLDRRRPPLLMYGQRRMGKTSLLNNLGRLLPSTIVPLFVDLQGPASRASNHAGFLYNIARSIIQSAKQHRNLKLSPLTRETLQADPFTQFDEWLDEVEDSLSEDGQKTALLTLDEFEVLDKPLSDGRFDEEAILGMFRHLIQHRPRFKVLLAGSHTLDEFQHWASYLINVQTIHITYLNEAEAHQLIERPTVDFALRYQPEASHLVFQVTRGHPALLQLLCAEIVALKNEQSPAQRRLVETADVQTAIPEALMHGSFFFADIARNQVSESGLTLLKFLAKASEAVILSKEALAEVLPDDSPDDLETVLAQLLRRELIETVEGGYRFQVELIRRWFAK